MEIPHQVQNILDKLESCGFSAFIAGGAVRDMLLLKKPKNFDIATNALPHDVKRIFSKTLDTGISHGTVTVVENNEIYEITTFRHEGEDYDLRTPSSVQFASSPEIDCSHRDFTINAMMYNPRTGLIDYWDGQKDLRDGIIKCVGDPSKRFREDALRMLRAVRFSAELSFKINSKTEYAIKKYAVLIKKISGERTRNELNKILLSPNPDYFRELYRLGLLRHVMPELERCFGEPQRNKYHIYDVGEHIMHAVKNAPEDLLLRWSALLHDIGKPCCPSTDKEGIIHFYGHHRESRAIALDILHRLRVDNDLMHDVLTLVENHDVRVEPTPVSVKRMMARVGENLFIPLLLLQSADNSAKNPRYYSEKRKKTDEAIEIYKQVTSERQPYMISQLAVNGKDLMKMGFSPGRRLGDTLKLLLDDVIKNPSLNNRSYLMARAKELRKGGNI